MSHWYLMPFVTVCKIEVYTYGFNFWEMTI